MPRLLLVWLVTAGFSVLWTGGWKQGFDPEGWYVVAHASLPLLLAAAYAIEEASRRLISSAWVILAIALPLAVRLGGLMATLRPEGPLVWVTIALVGGVAAWLVARLIAAMTQQTGLRRGSLMAAILFAITINSADGVAELFRRSADDDGYRQLVSRLASHRGAEGVVLLSDSASFPPELVYAFRASFPEAAMEVGRSWDEAITGLDRRLGAVHGETIVATWGVREGAGVAPADTLRPLGGPLLFAGRELLLHSTAGGGP